jgi:predicted amidohydrolase
MKFAPQSSCQLAAQSLAGCLTFVFFVLSMYSATVLGQDTDAIVAKDAPSKTVRIATCQAQARSVDWRLKDRQAVLEAIDRNIQQLQQIIHTAGQEKCDALALPEDTLGLLHWFGANQELAREILPIVVPRMLSQLGAAAAKENMYLVLCSDNFESDGGVYNTAFLLGRDGKEIGRYHKVCPTWSESGRRARGSDFPVFQTPDLGTVGLTICYDLVFPETARCLALQGADLIFFPTMGGAAIGDDDIGMQALRVRAAENQIYLAVAFRGSGAMIISPQGKILSQAKEPDGFAIADIDPHGGREGGDAANLQQDMRARLFRERNPAAFAILSDLNPPVLSKVPAPTLSRQRAGDIFERMLTVGQEEFNQAQRLVRDGHQDEAVAAFKRLIEEYPETWIDRASQTRLAELHAPAH